jgi:hypothetical protein
MSLLVVKIALQVVIVKICKNNTFTLISKFIRAAIEKSDTKSGWVVPIRNVSYDETKDSWSVEFAPEQEEPFKVEIKDNVK